MQSNQKAMETGLVLAATEAVLYVSDFQRACDYFVGKLGFEIEFAYGEPPFYGLVKRDRARLCIQLVCEPVFVGDIREREQLLSAAVTVATTTEIKQLSQEYKAAGVNFFQTLRKEPWALATSSFKTRTEISFFSRVRLTRGFQPDDAQISGFLQRKRERPISER